MNKRSDSLKQRHRMLMAAAIFAGLISVVFLLSLWQGWLWFRQPVFPGPAEQPGAAVGLANEWVVDAHEMDLLEQRMMTLLDEGDHLVSWFRLAGRTGTPAAVRSGEKRAVDQLLYGQYLLEQRRKGDFAIWWQTFAHDFLTHDGVIGLLPGEPSWLADMAVEPGNVADDAWRANLMAARLLAQSCTVWPDQDRLDAVSELSDLMLTRHEEQLPFDFETARPTPVPILDPGATPTPKPTASTDLTSTPDPEATPTADAPNGEGIRPGNMQALRLASIDLLAARQLVAIDNRWQMIYEQWLAWVDGGYLGDDLPLYAWAVDAESEPAAISYLPFTGATPAVHSEEAVRTLLHLAEVGQLKASSLQWLKNQLYNQGKIYESYHIVQGTPMTGSESIAAYAMIARIARIQADQPLYDLAVERLLWHQATNAKSAALSALFRQNESAMITVVARDNLLGLLAMR